MGRKSREKKERRAVERRAAIEAMHDSARTKVRLTAAAADPGPHPLLPDRLLRKRLAMRDRLADGAASLWVVASLMGQIAGIPSPTSAPERTEEILHELDARTAWEELLTAQDSDPGTVPDQDLCRIVADCKAVDRGEDLDPLLAGTWWASQDLAERLNETSSSDVGADQLAAELAETESLLAAQLGEQARSLLLYVAVEATLEFQYPKGAWPTAAQLPGGLTETEGALGSWAAAEGLESAEAVAFAARLAPRLRQITEHRFHQPSDWASEV